MHKVNKFRVVTNTVRFSYVNVFQPLPGDERRPKYSISIIIPKTDEETINAINQAVYDCKQQNKHVWGGEIPDDLTGGLRDGDLEKNDPAYDGCMFINATSITKPPVVDAECKPITNAYEFYSGCYGRASLIFYAHASYGTHGIGCTINNLQKLEEGERLGSFSSPHDDFGKR